MKALIEAMVLSVVVPGAPGQREIFRRCIANLPPALRAADPPAYANSGVRVVISVVRPFFLLAVTK